MNAAVELTRVLVVDDDKFDHLAYRRLFKKANVTVDLIPCYYARDALEYLRRPDHAPCDAIFLDINMPAMNGLEFLAAASAEFGDAFSQQVVAVISTSMDPRDQEAAGGYDAVKAFFSKPMTVEKIAHIATLVAEARRAHS